HLDNASFSNTDRNYTNTYRNIAVRLANDLTEKGEVNKAREVLDKVMEMIPDQPRYDYGLSTERIAQAYHAIGDTEKAQKLIDTAKARLMEKIDFYESLPDNLRYTVARDLADTRSDYSLMVYGRVTELMQRADTAAALEFFRQEYNPVREKLIQSYQEFNRDGNMDIREQNNIDGQFRFISELLGIADMIDTVYAENESRELYQILTNEN